MTTEDYYTGLVSFFGVVITKTTLTLEARNGEEYTRMKHIGLGGKGPGL